MNLPVPRLCASYEELSLGVAGDVIYAHPGLVLSQLHCRFTQRSVSVAPRLYD